MRSLKKIAKRIIMREKSDSQSFVKWLRRRGVKVGEETTVFRPDRSFIDTTRPWMVEIGNNVQITEGVTILTHGYDWAVLKCVYGDVLGSSGGVKIGDNVFIGMKATILKGVTIGNNVIIGANSLVNKDIPDNCIAAGNPCRVIMSLEEYYEKRKAVQYEEASQLVRKYRERYGKDPGKEALHEFFFLFEDNEKELFDSYRSMMELCSNSELSYARLKEHKKLFASFDEFLNSVK
ncbi:MULTISPECIES: acyltransferase [Clostridia]|uniref:acyltransferase n=1 Tax=Clostridia TaxID=186801 RepID=UPI001FAA9473|nr:MULTISPECIES: acyltransferase [Clostridia]